MFDEMSLQKCEEYVGGETIGSDEVTVQMSSEFYDNWSKKLCTICCQNCS